MAIILSVTLLHWACDTRNQPLSHAHMNTISKSHAIENLVTEGVCLVPSVILANVHPTARM